MSNQQPDLCHLQLAKRVICAAESRLHRKLVRDERIFAVLDATRWTKPFARQVVLTIEHANTWRKIETQL
jgi:hypothetical protein